MLSIHAHTPLLEINDCAGNACCLLHAPMPLSAAADRSAAGVTYVFVTKPSESWIGRGEGRALVLSEPRLLRHSDGGALMAEAAEVQRQIDTNTGLSEKDKLVLAGRLQKLQLRLADGTAA